jgi:hypothetical protein
VIKSEDFLYFCQMTVKDRLRNNLIRRIQRLSADKLTEVNDLLGNLEKRFKSKDKTLNMAGSWKDLGGDFFVDLTEKLHDNRANDRKVV